MDKLKVQRVILCYCFFKPCGLDSCCCCCCFAATVCSRLLSPGCASLLAVLQTPAASSGTHPTAVLPLAEVRQESTLQHPMSGRAIKVRLLGASTRHRNASRKGKGMMWVEDQAQGDAG